MGRYRQRGHASDTTPTMPIPTAVKRKLHKVASGADFIFDYTADELADVIDAESLDRPWVFRGGELILRCLFNDEIDHFSSMKFQSMIDDDSQEVNVAAVLDTLDEYAFNTESCFQECGGRREDWNDVDYWREVACARLLMEHFVLAARMKIYVIRFRKRVHAPGGALYQLSRENFKRCTAAIS